MMYIYCITNNVNGKTYIGQHAHKTTKRDTYMGSGKLLKYAKKKYGDKNFYKEILIKAENKEQLNILEKFYIMYYKLVGKAEYNIASGGEGSGSHFWKGRTFSESHKAKLKESRNKRPRFSEETKIKMSLSQTGKVRTIEARKKYSDSKIGNTYGTANKGRKCPSIGSKWYNDGYVNVRSFKQPDGFTPGRKKEIEL